MILGDTLWVRSGLFLFNSRDGRTDGWSAVPMVAERPCWDLSDLWLVLPPRPSWRQEGCLAPLGASLEPWWGWPGSMVKNAPKDLKSASPESQQLA